MRCTLTRETVAAILASQNANGELLWTCRLGESERKQCVLTIMLQNGVQPGAVASAESEGRRHYAGDFQDTGAIDVKVVCAQPTNLNCGYSCVLVNGMPDRLQIAIDRFDGSGNYLGRVLDHLSGN